MSGVWMGLDIGGTKLLGVAVRDDGHKILAVRRMPTRREEGPESVWRRVIALGQDIASEAGDIAAIGICFAGIVDHEAGVVVDSSVILPGWDGFPLAERAAIDLGLPCVIENDATAAGFGEFTALGSPPGLNMVLLSVGTGIGGALVIDGQLYRGASNAAAEFGNTTIDWRGHRCVSGNHGSLNTLASGTALCRRATQLVREGEETRLGQNGEPISGEAIAEAAASGDRVAIAAIDEAARALGAGIANFLNIFNPDRVVLTGGICMLGEGYLETVTAEAHARAFPVVAEHARITFSSHGELACAHGAACLAASRVPEATR